MTIYKHLIQKYGSTAWHMNLNLLYSDEFEFQVSGILYEEFGLQQDEITFEICEQVYTTLITRMEQ